jgi:hypothetical protein
VYSAANGRFVQASHTVLADDMQLDTLYWPVTHTEHVEHAVAPPSEYFPASQAVHAPIRPTPKVPAGQAVHTLAPLNA